ncbi:MAG: hypothetical protein F6K48_22165 [Okeania sp. SIO3H1]|uniref:hypothetical protein n=1 Tax=Okeania sp. SIO1I7 TaxID=2607772 RepID=UPI0013C78502|nr:hypothetical protein [Okeania sp. SIO1I7]NEN91461.1 hypothetical protein [Okeania sp. SIO3H1]NET28625.1 hypothetical protein [Okeania sp. SIO1I7]
MIYKKLFELSILHEYYTNELCPDFILEPTIECRKILSGHRLIIKNKVNGIVIISPVDPDDESQPQIELADNLRFTFLLKLQNQKIVNFTERDFQGSIFFNLQEEQLKDGLKCPAFSNKNSNQPGVVQLEEDTVILYYQELPESGTEEKIKLSYEDLPGGQIVWGIVIIENNSSMAVDLNQSSDYQITFEAKEQKWRYYLITNSPMNELLIQDQQENIIFSDLEEVAEDDPIFDTLDQQFPDPKSKKYFSESTSTILCQEEGINNIQLLKNSSIWIEHLPNPPNHNIIKVSGLTSQEIIQYQVINLLTDSQELKTKKIQKTQNKG